MMSYWVLFIGIAVVSWLVQMNLQNKFKKYSKIPTGNGMTGRDVALKMLHDNGIYDVQVTHTPLSSSTFSRRRRRNARRFICEFHAR